MRRREFIAGLGGAAAWPLAASAQQTGVPPSQRQPLPNDPVIGVLDMAGPRRPKDPFFEAFRKGLEDGGFGGDANLFILYRWAGGDFMRLQELVADLVGRQVAAIVAIGALAPVARTKRTTSTIPIVFLYGGDAVKDGLVASLNRPGGNVTGIMGIIGGESGGLEGKRLELLLQLVPQARKIGFLSNGRAYGYEQWTTSMLAAGRALGVEIMVVECHDDRDYEPAVANMVEGGAGGMILSNFVLPNLGKVVQLAASHKLPAIYPYQSLVRFGGLMSYEADFPTLAYRLGSAYVARIVKGAKPADLPVEQPTKFNFAINLKTAKALGLSIPPNLLAVADQVIE
jgi:putative tryptophan/tyrosine transport system substrate-binding protein